MGLITQDTFAGGTDVNKACVAIHQADSNHQPGTSIRSPHHAAIGKNCAKNPGNLMYQTQRLICFMRRLRRRSQPSFLGSGYRDCAVHANRTGRPVGRLGAQCFLICQPSREAERKFCAVGRPAWMPGEPRRAMGGPWRRAHGAGPERGNLSAAKAVRWGEDFLVPFWSFKKGLAVRAKPISRLNTNAGYVPHTPVKPEGGRCSPQRPHA